MTDAVVQQEENNAYTDINCTGKKVPSGISIVNNQMPVSPISVKQETMCFPTSNSYFLESSDDEKVIPKLNTTNEVNSLLDHVTTTVHPPVPVENKSVSNSAITSHPSRTSSSHCTSIAGNNTVPNVQSKGYRQHTHHSVFEHTQLVGSSTVSQRPRTFRPAFHERANDLLISGLHKDQSYTSNDSGTSFEKNYFCVICKKKFGRKYRLLAHMKTHDGQGDKLHCDICNKQFIHQRSLHQHMNIHTREDNFTCDVCGKEFNVLSNLYRHKRSLHGTDGRLPICNDTILKVM